MRSTPAMTSATANRPISVGMNWKPLSSGFTPKVKRLTLYVGSRPTVQSTMPKNALIMPLAMDLPEMATMTDRPNTASISISAEVNFMATFATVGERKVMTSAPITPPQKEENMAMESALPAWPFWHIG